MCPEALYTIIPAKLKVFRHVQEEISKGHEPKLRHASRLYFFCDFMYKRSLCLLKLAIFLAAKLC